MRISDWSSDVCASDLGPGTMAFVAVSAYRTFRISVRPNQVKISIGGCGMMTEEPDRLDPDEVVPKLLHAKTRCLWARGQFALRFHSKEPPQKCLHPIFSVSRRVATAERCRGGPLDARGLKLPVRLLAD